MCCVHVRRYAVAYLRHRLVTRIAQQAAAFGEGVREVLGDSEKLLGMGSVKELKAAWARLCSAPPGTLRPPSAGAHKSG